MCVCLRTNKNFAQTKMQTHIGAPDKIDYNVSVSYVTTKPSISSICKNILRIQSTLLFILAWLLRIVRVLKYCPIASARCHPWQTVESDSERPCHCHRGIQSDGFSFAPLHATQPIQSEFFLLSLSLCLSLAVSFSLSLCFSVGQLKVIADIQ